MGGASVADNPVQDHFTGQDEDDALARAGKTYTMLYFGPVQAALYTAGELTYDTQLSTTSKKAFASLLGAQSLIHLLKYLTPRRRPDGSDRLAFPSVDVGAASSLIPAVYTGYGLAPAHAWGGFSRPYWLDPDRWQQASSYSALCCIRYETGRG